MASGSQGGGLGADPAFETEFNKTPRGPEAAEDVRRGLPYCRTREDWRQVILDDLGGEGVDADLTERNLDAALNRALECWNQYRPLTTWYPFSVPSVLSGAENGFVIEFFADEARTDDRRYPYGFVRNVLDVRFVDRDRRILGPHVGSREGYFLRWGFQGPRLFFQLHVGERVYERLTGTRPDWRWDPSSRRLFLSVPSRDVLVMVLASRERKLDEINFDRWTDFRRLAVAAAKRILARIQGQFPKIPGPAGNIETDAPELRQEAKEEWKEIEDKLQRALSSVPPVGYIG